MTENLVITLGREALYAVLLVSAPMLGVSLLVGLLVSIFQATTQIQEQTLAFIPKIIAVLITVVIFAPWMMKVMLSFTQKLLLNMHLLAK
ncbi:MAG TPA: flagellar biosynthesis protein FliQ [Syntrophomonadaceae bacterium]|nr:flagellar biosynthesis protein FliQ [Syntrophomonadaceae bacterium]